MVIHNDGVPGEGDELKERKERFFSLKMQIIHNILSWCQLDNTPVVMISVK